MADAEQIARIRESLRGHYDKAKERAKQCDISYVIHRIRRAEEFLTRMDDNKVLSLSQYIDIASWLDKEVEQIASTLKARCK